MYVKCTSTIWHEITGNINALYKTRLEEANSFYNYGMTKDEFDRHIHSTLISDEEAILMAKLGPRFFKSVTSLPVALVTGEIDHGIGYNLEFKRETLVPERWLNYYDSPKVDCNAIKGVLACRSQALNALNKEITEFTEKMKKLFEGAGSVNRLVKLWPAVENFLSIQTKQRLNKKQDARPKDEAAEIGVDLHEMSVGLLKAKIAA